MNFDPYLSIQSFTRGDIATMGDAVLAAVTEDRDLAPDKFGLSEPFKVDLAGARALWRSEAAQPVGLLSGERRRPFRIDFLGVFGIVSRRQFHEISWSSHPVALHRVGAKRIEALFLRLVAATDPYLAGCYHSDDFERQNVDRDFRHKNGVIEPYRIVGVHPHKVIPGLYWLNYFGPELSASMPALAGTGAGATCGATPLGKGTLLKLAEDPLQMLLPETIERVRLCKQALGEHLFFDRARPLPEDEPLELEPPRVKR